MDVSVIVPVYKGKRFLSGLFSMMRSNAEADPGIQMELILVNDDPDEEIILPSTEDLPFTARLLVNPANSGIFRSRMKGVSEAKGRYILFLDQDDEIADNAVSVLFREAAGGDAALSGWFLEIKQEKCIRRIENRYRRSADLLNALLLCDNVIGPPGHCLISKEIVLESWKNLSLSNDGADDYYLWLSFLLNGHRFSVCDELLYTHKYNEDSFSLQYERMFAAREEVLGLIAERFVFSPSGKKRMYRYLDYQTERERLLISGAPAFRRYLFYLRNLPRFLYHMFVHYQTYLR